jgi:hypothetical protein
MGLEITRGAIVSGRTTIRCAKCGDHYEGLACLSCAKRASYVLLRDRMQIALGNKDVDLYWTKAGHLTVGKLSWRSILRDFGLKPNRDLAVPTICGEPAMWGSVSDMRRDSQASGLALYFKVDEFKKCKECVSN